MTTVDFHTGVDDPLGYLCRLLRKASASGSRVRACAPDDLLQQLDQALWTFDPQSFVPHLRIGASVQVPSRLSRTALWLTPPLMDWPAGVAPCEVLVRCRCPADAELGRWRRVVEVVSTDLDDQRMARRQWRLCLDQGLEVRHHPAPTQG
jgi:DNA polymerase-3 subunit chi